MTDYAAAFQGNLGFRTVSVYVIDPITGTPLEPVPDLVPGVSPFRWTADIIDSESQDFTYSVTQNALQDLTDATSNVHRELRRISITGTLSDTIQVSQSIPFGGGSPPVLRYDILRMKNLVAIADQRQPVMVVTPRGSLPKAFIENINIPWTPENGYSTVCNVSFVEARVVSPLTGALLPDYSAQLPGKNADSGGGQQAAQPTQLTVQQSIATIGAPIS